MQHRLVARDPEQPVRPLLVAGVLVAWAITLTLSMSGAAVVRHDRLLAGGLPLWEATAVFLGGWQVMLWAMMVPGSARTISRQRSAAAFIGVLLGVWTVFGLATLYFDAGVHATVSRWPWLAEHSWLISGSVLLLAGAYQLSDLKARSLAACRHLATVEDAGLRYGLSCLGADWALMLVGFALGAGSIALMAALTAVMVAESTSNSNMFVKPVGYALVAIGALTMAGPIQLP